MIYDEIAIRAEVAWEDWVEKHWPNESRDTFITGYTQGAIDAMDDDEGPGNDGPTHSLEDCSTPFLNMIRRAQS